MVSERLIKLYYEKLKKPTIIYGLVLHPFMVDNKIKWEVENPNDVSFASDVVEGHLEESMQGHLLLALRRVMEQQEVIVKLNCQVEKLERGENERVSAIAALTAGIAAVELTQSKMFKVNSESSNSLQFLEKKVDGLGKELRMEVAKEVGYLNGSLGREVQRANDGVAEIQNYLRNQHGKK